MTTNKFFNLNNLSCFSEKEENVINEFKNENLADLQNQVKSMKEAMNKKDNEMEELLTKLGPILEQIKENNKWTEKEG